MLSNDNNKANYDRKLMTEEKPQKFILICTISDFSFGSLWQLILDSQKYANKSFCAELIKVITEVTKKFTSNSK